MTKQDEQRTTTDANDRIRTAVREAYGQVARNDDAGCCGPTACGGEAGTSLGLGYEEGDLASVPEGADLGLGCGNPPAIAALRPGEVVLDLGSGGGLDCFLASKQVGESGQVIGVDMTSDMISKARRNAAKMGASNVEFRLGEIEHLPVADTTVDAILSNCVINLSPDKSAVFHEAFRVLVPGGRLAISDIVATADMPREMQEDVAALTGCLAGAAPVAAIEGMLQAAGFVDVEVRIKPGSRAFIANWKPGSGYEDYVASAYIKAVKPA